MNDFGKIKIRDNMPSRQEEKKERRKTDVSFDILKKSVRDLQNRVVDVWQWYSSKNTEIESSGKYFKNDTARNLNRRDFLKLVSATTAIGILKPGNLLQGEEEEIKRQKLGSNWDEADQHELLPNGIPYNKGDKLEGIGSAEQEIESVKGSIENKNYTDLKKNILNQYIATGKVNILSVKESIKKYWMKEHDFGGKQYRGLNKALNSMGEWYSETQEIFSNTFQRKGLKCPDWLAYLGVAESYWGTGADHYKERPFEKKAVGVFQLTATIARKYGLVVDQTAGIDERENILMNAMVAAEFLSDLYLRTRKNMGINSDGGEGWDSDSWKLTLGLYNGAYVGRFFRKATKSGKKVNYDNYLKFREGNFQQFLDNKLKNSFYLHIVKKGDTLNGLANRYRVKKLSIKEDNDLSNDSIKLGQKLKINVPKKSVSGRIRIVENLLSKELSSAIENLNYPEKFIAILEIMKRRDLFLNNDKDIVEHNRDDGVPILIKKANKFVPK
jgi:hypothetical protein